MLALRANIERGFTCALGVGGIGTGVVYALQGDHELGRNESRLGELLDARDYCKLHIVLHYIARLMDCSTPQASFRVLPVGVVGDDETGRRIISEMSAAGMDTQFVRSHAALRTPFSVCFMYPDGSGGSITSNNSAASALSVSDLNAALPYMKAAGSRGVALCLPEVPLELRRTFLELAADCGNYRVCSLVLGEIQEAQRMGMVALLDLLALNQEEASALLGGRHGQVLEQSTLAARAAELTATHPGLQLIVSVGQEGAYGFDRGSSQFCPAPVVRAISTAGAGDALLAGILCGLAAGLPFIVPSEDAGAFCGRTLRSALDLGVLNASFSVTSRHTIHPDAVLEKLTAFAESHGASLADSVRTKCCEFDPSLRETVPNVT